MRILFVQPSLQPPGGGNGVAAWMIQALRDEHDLTVLTWAEVRLDEVNRHFGTALRPGDARFLRAHPRLAGMLDLLPTPTDLLKTALLMRAGRGRAPAFDLAISGNNEADLGDRALQYIHYPRYQRPRPGADLRWFHAASVLRAYYRLADAASGISFERMRANRTLVNSGWTGRLVKSLHGIDAVTLHPPVSAPAPVEWEAREDAFLCLGRISPEKEIEKVISILERVRARGHEVALTIAGGRGPFAYMREIHARVESRAPWARLLVDLDRGAWNRLIASSRYGIHGMSEEHFGMAPAEMVAAGCLVFMPGGGGQGEILDGDPRLLYSSEQDAVEKIDRMLRSKELQTEAREALARKGELLGVEAFCSRLRAIVSEIGPRP
ncbi:MAG: glycosyltransferase family 4 protein [Vicinamibacteria bacterium]|nr:glycosyltransferase family 4 protein [Vicinamibacteria bacterium]